MKVAQVVLVQDGQAAGGLQAGRQERAVVELGPLDHPHAGQPGDPRPVAALGRRQDHGDRLAVAGRQLLRHPRGERVVAADDEVTGTCGRGRVRGHAVSLTG